MGKTTTAFESSGARKIWADSGVRQNKEQANERGHGKKNHSLHGSATLVERPAWAYGFFQFLETGSLVVFRNAEKHGFVFFIQLDAAAVFFYDAPHHVEEQQV